MMTRQNYILLASGPLTALVVAACATTLNPGPSNVLPDDGGAVVVVDATPDVGSSSGGPDAAVGDAPSDAPSDSSASCTYINLSGSSSSGGMCETTEEYSCSGNTVEITCNCPANTCKCGLLTLTGNCAQSCLPTAAIRAQCGVDTEPPSGGDGGGSSSSSSGK